MKKLFLLLTVFAYNLTFGQYSYMGGANNGAYGPRPMIQLQSGDINELKKVTKVNILYDYKEMGVGAFKKEEDYIAKKFKDYEEKGKKDKAEKLKQSWDKGKNEIYPNHFEELFNKYGAKINLTGKNNGTTAEYTLTVKTTFFEPGYNIGIDKKPAYVDMECIFTDKAGKELVRYFVKNAIGSNSMGFDFDVSSRVVESYGKAAKMLVKAIAKDRKKAAKKKK